MMVSLGRRGCLFATWMLAACGPGASSETDPGTTAADTTTSTSTTSTTGDGSTTGQTMPPDSSTDGSTSLPPISTTSGFNKCVCSNEEPLDPIPEACAGVAAPPPGNAFELRGWMPADNTIVATSLESSFCSSMDPETWMVDCPCSGVYVQHRYDFASAIEIGDHDVTQWTADASCRDECERWFPAEPPPTVSVAILAETPDCIIGQTQGDNVVEIRFYVDRQACSG